MDISKYIGLGLKYGGNIDGYTTIDGYVLTYSATDNKWEPKPSVGVSGSFTAGGDLSGTGSSQQVIGLTGSSGIISIATTGSDFQWTQGTTSPSITQLQQANGSNPNSITISPQAPGSSAGSTATGTPGSFIVNVAVPVSTGAEAALVFERNTSPLFAVSNYPTLPTWGTLYLGSNASTRGNNYTIVSDGSFLQLNAPSGSIAFNLSGTTEAALSGTSFLIGNGQTNFTGTSNALCIGSGTLGSTKSTGCGVISQDATIGLHYTPPDANSFIDYMLAPVLQGTASTQALKSQSYLGAASTTTTSAVTILTIPIPTGSVTSIQAFVNARDVSSGTVNDGFTKIELWQYKNISGTVTAAATNAVSIAIANDTSMSTCTVTASISGTNVLIQVAGLLTTTIDWTAKADVLIT